MPIWGLPHVVWIGRVGTDTGSIADQIAVPAGCHADECFLLPAVCLTFFGANAALADPYGFAAHLTQSRKAEWVVRQGADWQAGGRARVQ